MDFLNRNEVKTIVEDSLGEVADWNGDCEGFRIDQIPQTHAITFIDAIQSGMKEQGLRISISHGSAPTSGIYNYEYISDLIDYIYDKQVRRL